MVTIIAEAAFEQELEIFRKEEETAQQRFFVTKRDIGTFATKYSPTTKSSISASCNTRVDEMKALFGFLHALHEALWQLFQNGRKLGLNARAFVLPPTSMAGAQMLPGEKVFREGQRVLAHVVQGLKAETKSGRSM